MKRLVSILLAALALLALVSCKKEEKKGPTEVDYGEVHYIGYDDGTPLTFEYLSCFKETEMEDQLSFMTYTDDRLGVLTYKVYDPVVAAEYESYTAYESPSKTYAQIRAFSDEEAENYLRVALGMISSQGAEYTIDSFSFDKNEHDLRLWLEATAVYEKTGEIQKLWMLKIVTEGDCVYTLQAFAPASIVTKYGPAFRNAQYAENNN